MKHGGFSRHGINVGVKSAVGSVMGDEAQRISFDERIVHTEQAKDGESVESAFSVDVRAEIRRFMSKEVIKKAKICALRSKEIEGQKEGNTGTPCSGQALQRFFCD